MPPLGIAYIGAQLLKDGHNVKISCFNSQLFLENRDKQFLWDWDMSDEWSSAHRLDKYFNIGETVESWVKSILVHNPSLIGFSVNSHSKLLANLMADKIKEKKKDCCVVFGGPFCSELSRVEECNKNVDIYVRGEGEKTVSLIAQTVACGESIRDLNIKGTVVNTGAGFKDNGWARELLDIDSIPFPALRLFDLDNYSDKEKIPIIFSRGCDFYCKFCTDKPMWGNYRMRKAENIINEMVNHSKIFNRQSFKCNDLMVNGDVNGLVRLSEQLILRQLSFTWGGMARARADMTQDMFSKARSAGCLFLTYGVESGAAKVLSHMGKPPKETITQALKMTREAKIKVNTLWMAGYPVERWSDFLETLFFLFQNRGYIGEFVSVSSCYIPTQSWLYKQQNTLKIKYNKQSEWYVGRSNNPWIRTSRKSIMLFLARCLGLYKEGIK